MSCPPFCRSPVMRFGSIILNPSASRKDVPSAFNWRVGPSLADFTPAVVRDDAALAAFDSVLALREVVTKALEDARSAKKINKSQEARVVVYAQPEVCRAAGSFDAGVFEELFIVSRRGVAELRRRPEEHVEVLAAEGEKCPRCWSFRELGGNAAHPAVCKRCGDALDALGFTEE